MKSFALGALIALLGPFSFLFRPVRSQLIPVRVRRDDQRNPRR